MNKRNINTGITVSASDCLGCDLSDRNFPKIKIKNTNLTGSLFNRTNLSGGVIYNTDLTGAHFKKAFLALVQGENVILRGANMSDATMTEIALADSYFNGATMTGVDIKRATFKNCDFDQVNLSGAKGLGADFTGSTMTNAVFHNANMTGSIFDTVNLSNTKFGTANLNAVSFNNASLVGADLSSARGLKQSQLDLACGDSNTSLPVGLFITYCAASADMDMEAHAESHPGLAEREQEIALRVDRSLETLENVMQNADPKLLKELEMVHQDLSAVQRKIEQ
ncbi:MAG: pentapeptide repeat-containing protein [Hellea sp.]|nr:pentapeptide repeat-containing protein [Hellea sp.]